MATSSTALVFLPIAGAPPTIEWIPVGAISIDESYQRSIDSRASQRLIQQIACGWDWRLFNPLSLSRREGGLYVIDGQHRLAAAKLRGDLPHLPSVVANFASAADEARAFVAVNTARRSPTTLDRFRGRCAAGDTKTLAIAALIAKAGLTLGRSVTKINPGEIISVRICERMYGHYGEEIFGAAIMEFALGFPGEAARAIDELLPGLCFGAKSFPESPLAPILSQQSQSDWFHLVAVMRNQNDGRWVKSYDQTLYELFIRENRQPAPQVPEEPPPLRPPAPPPLRANPKPQSLLADITAPLSAVPPSAWQAARAVGEAMGKPSLIRNGEFVIGDERFTPDQIIAKAAQLRAENAAKHA